MEKKTMHKLRLAIGLLGLLLPGLLVSFHHAQVLPSMSHYYYTGSAVVFITIIGAMSILLTSYVGYPKAPGEKISDNLITTIAGIAAGVLVIVPTASNGVSGLDYTDQPYLLGYAHGELKNTIHLVSAGIFISLLGCMSFFQFVKSPAMLRSMFIFYRTCGILVWAAVGALLVLIILDRTFGLHVSSWFPDYVFWLEVVAVWSFAVAWLAKADPFGIIGSWDAIIEFD